MVYYEKTKLIEVFDIKKIVSVHYFEFAKNYVFDGEKHDFWEFVYVDKGEVEVMAETTGYKLKQGEMIFHKPNEFHNVWANGKVAPNIIIVSFECLSSHMDFFKNKIFNIIDSERTLLAQIIREAKEAFSTPFDVSCLAKLEKRTSQLFGCEHLIKIYLVQLLINLVRINSNIRGESRISKVTKERSEGEMIKKITTYLNNNIYNNLTFNDVYEFCALSKTNLKSLFKEKMGVGVMEYFKALKIEEAKTLIKESELNFTEISEKLSYASIHYFSRHFKRATGMNPSQYASSVKIMI